MPDIRILTEQELREIVPLDLAAIDRVEFAFRALAGGHVIMPPVLSIPIVEFNGEVDVKTAYVPGLDSFAIKVSPGFFDNPSLGLPSTSGLMILFSARTGMLETLLLDNGYLTDVRTAAAGAVAARYLSSEDASRACVLGAGVQGKLQLEALMLVRPIRHATVWARDAGRAEIAAAELRDRLGIDITAVADAAEAVSGADIIVTTTPSRQPILQAEWLSAGQHITAMGSDQHGKNELAPAVLQIADVYVADRLSQTRELGELRSALEAGVAPAESAWQEIGRVITGADSGRRSADDLTIVDLTGTGVQDTAIATLARERSEARKAGQNFRN